MKTVSNPASSSYQDYLVEALQKPERAAGLIEAILAEQNPEPQLLAATLADIIAARSKAGTLSETAQQHYEKLCSLLIESGGAEVYALVQLLEALGFEVSVTAKSGA
jgi:DNA-binding phage protein